MEDAIELGNAVAEPEKAKEISGKGSRRGWFWPVGVAVTSMAGMAVLALRGCWHRKMSWPLRMQEHSYQVCLGCGAKRLFDEKKFCAYGPYRYDLNELIAWEKARRVKAEDGRRAS